MNYCTLLCELSKNMYFCSRIRNNKRIMKQMMMTLLCALVFAMPSFAQGINDKADNIVGEYLTDCGGTIMGIGTTLYWTRIK